MAATFLQLTGSDGDSSLGLGDLFDKSNGPSSSVRADSGHGQPGSDDVQSGRPDGWHELARNRLVSCGIIGRKSAPRTENSRAEARGEFEVVDEKLSGNGD